MTLINKFRKTILICLVCTVATVAVFAQATSEITAAPAIDRAVEKIQQHIILKEYDKAYSYTLFVLKFYGSYTLPLETSNTIERELNGYYEYLSIEQKYEEIITLQKDLSLYPSSVQRNVRSYIDDASAQLNRKRELEIKKEQDLAHQQEIERNNQMLNQQRAQIDDILAATRKFELEKQQIMDASRIATAEQQKELENARQEAERQYRNDLTSMVERINTTNIENIQSITKNNNAIIICFSILAVFVILIIVVLVVVSLRQQRLQSQQYQNTMRTMQAMRTITPTYDSLPYQASGSPLLNLPNSKNPLMIETTTDKDKMTALLVTCKKYGEQIDEKTGRKNASQRVAELVYKISQQLKYSEQDSILFFAVGLVYDIGFLNIESSILHSECISKEQFEILKTHTEIGLNMVFFVDEDYRQLFRDGVSMHHENLDGTGYPHGLKDKEIPYIARVLHVAESYIALISSRDYRQIRDHNAAVEELRASNSQYDQSIVDALDAIV